MKQVKQTVRLNLSLRDYLDELISKGLQELEEEQLDIDLKEAVKQSKEGKVSSLGSFAKYLENEI